MILVTGGAGFIGANFILSWLARKDEAVINLDRLSYAGNLASLASLADDPRHVFVHGDIRDRALLAQLFATHRPRAVLHFAAESHVDRSIHAAGEFVDSNVVGTFTLLDEALAYWKALPGPEREAFRFVNVSTDEVYGSLEPDDPPFSESAAYAPNSPYSASKAGADHFARAYAHTHGLPVITTHCSNNYGPRQFPEKLIPLMIHRALAGETLPVYGDGRNVRDWLYVDDHCRALERVLAAGRPGSTYCIGGANEIANLDLVHALCDALQRMRPHPGGHYADLIRFVADRPGHDRRYAIDAGRMRQELGWAPAETFVTGLQRTLAWYLENPGWVADIVNGTYRDWVGLNYGKRPGAHTA